MKAFVISVALGALLCGPAEARHHYSHRAPVYAVHPDCNVLFPCEGVAPSVRGEHIAKSVGLGAAKPVYTPETVLPHPQGCPRRAFCGCGAALHVFGAPLRSLWLAANWLKFPSAAPAPGMAAVRRHHVFIIEAVLGGNKVLAYDANSGRHLTRRHVRSLAGYRVVNPHGGRYASLG